jgi:hypothetical protein
VSKLVRLQKLLQTNKQTNKQTSEQAINKQASREASEQNSFWHYRQPLFFPYKVKATLACEVYQNAYEGQTKTKYLRK